MNPLETHYNTVFTKTIDMKQCIETNLNRRFPVNYNRDSKYLFLLNKYDKNSILVRPIKAIMEIYFLPVFRDLHEYRMTRGLKPSYVTAQERGLTSLPEYPKGKNYRLPDGHSQYAPT